MNYKHLLIAILAGAALVGCNKEKSAPDVISNDGEKNYMGFTISMPAATKAPTTSGTGSFEYGHENENKINTIHFFFYKDGAYVSEGYGNMGGQFTSEVNTNIPTENVEEFEHDGTTAKEGVVILNATMTEPNQVLCIINSRNAAYYKGKNLPDVLKALHSEVHPAVEETRGFYADGGPYFVMINSPMYGKNAKGAMEVKHATDIHVKKNANGEFAADSHIQATEPKAKANPVEIYVERLAARSEIANLADKVDGTGLFKADVYGAGMRVGGVLSGDPIWDIKPLGWSLTAVNKQSYALKHVDLAWQPTTAKAFTGWIESGDKVFNYAYNYSASQPDADKMYSRINWAIDPYYSDADNHETFPHGARELETKSAHKYYSATEVLNNYTKADWSAEDMLQRYCYENTFDAVSQRGENPRITGTMQLLYAQAKKKGTTDYVDIYNYMDSFLTYDEYAAWLLSNVFVDTKLYKLDGTDYKLLTKDDLQIVKAAKFVDVYSDNEASYSYDQDKASTVVTTPATTLKDLYYGYIIDLSKKVVIEGETNLTALPDMDANGYYPAGDGSIEKSYSDGYVTLVPVDALYKAGTTNELYKENPAHATDPSAPEYIAATDADVANAFLGKALDVANRYVEGKMYYAIPIEHYGRAMTEDTTPPTPGFVPEALEGHYGMVRNNYYKVNIGNINGMGHGIHDVNEPIVPGERKKPYYLAAKINILSWQIATQTADLEE